MVLLVAGCGGSSDDKEAAVKEAATTPTATPTPSPVPTKAEYIAEMDAICADEAVNKKANALERRMAAVGRALNVALQSGKSTDRFLAQIAKLHDPLIELRSARGEALAAVIPPAEGGATEFLARFDRMTDEMRQFAADVGRMHGPYERWLDDFNASVTAMTKSAAKSRKAARAFGITDCEAKPET